MNENNSDNSQDLSSIIDIHLEALKKEIQSYHENSTQSPSVSPKTKKSPINKLNELKLKFENTTKNLLEFSNTFPTNSCYNKKLENCNDIDHINLLKNIEKEKTEFTTVNVKNQETQKELNQTINDIKTEACEIIKKYENDCRNYKLELEKLEKSNKKLRKDIDEISQENAIQTESKIKEITDLTIENEALANEIGKLIQEKSKILEHQQINEEKYEKIIKTLEEETLINKEKCSTLHKDYSLIHDHSNFKIHKCEKEIELKIAEIHHLNDQVNILSNKMQEEKNKKLNLTEEKEALLESKNQEIINLKIDLNKMESKMQNQNEDIIKLERTHSITMESFDVVLEEKENEIIQLKKELKEAEEQLNDEKRKIQLVFESSSPMPISRGDSFQEEKKFEKEIDRMKSLETENEKLKKDLRIIKKSLKETLDLNDVFSRDLQKMKHKSILGLFFVRKISFLGILELKQKDQEIFKYRQMLERLDRLDSQNKVTQDLAEQKKNISFTNKGSFHKEQEIGGAFFDHKSVFSDRKDDQNKWEKESVETKQFPEDMKLHRDQEICKGCIIY